MDDGADRFNDDAEDDAPAHPNHKNRRRKTPFDLLMAVGSGAGAVAAIGVLLGAVTDFLPFAKATDVKALVGRVATVEHGLGAMQLAQQESLELALLDRAQKLEDALGRTPPTSSEYVERRQSLNETNQRLAAARAAIAAARAAAQIKQD